MLLSAKDNHIQYDSVGYTIYNNITISSFEKGWGKQINRICNSTSSIYGDTYIKQCKEKLKELFKIGTQNSLKEINAAMMRT